MEQKRLTGIVFDTQRYSIHDGPGIRTIIFFKGCPLRCPWCSNPESQKVSPEIWYNSMVCIGCNECVNACPEGLITRDENGLHINFADCRKCGNCAEACCSGALSMVGRERGVEELINLIERDRQFYERSGGGVTLSGGEPLLQSEFAAALLSECVARGISTAMETSGCAPWENVERVLPFMDIFLYDLKIFDPEKHKRVLKGDNEIIKSNLEKIVAAGKRVIIRVPLIPGYNDDVENIRDIIRYSENLGVEYVNILPYHRLGESKYKKLGKGYDVQGRPQETHEIEDLLKKVGTYSINVVIGG